MKRLVLHLTIIAVLLALLTVIGQGIAVSEEYIINGDFETGDFTGWEGFGDIVINDGWFYDPPISGAYDAWLMASPEWYEISVMLQFGLLPSGITSATISWSDRIFNECGEFVPSEYIYSPGQEVWVFILDLDTETFYDVFRTEPGDDPFQEGPNNRSFDVTTLLQSLEGHAVALVFWVNGYYDDIYFLLDNVSLDVVTTVDVDIDIKPGSYPNSINLGSNGKVPVAILGSADFDATTVDPYSVTLAGAEVVLKGKAQTPMASVEDVNEDGFDDLVVHVDTEALELSEEDTIAILEGETNDGTPIIGEDTIRVVP
ncbi:MAG: hypothetical protein ACMUIU_20105 [bacterium]